MQQTEQGPRSPNSRLFIGNLACEKTSPRELFEIFAKYGRIVEDIVLRRSFGFIQYDKPESALAAMQGEQGRIIGGMRIGNEMLHLRFDTRQTSAWQTIVLLVALVEVGLLGKEVEVVSVVLLGVVDLYPHVVVLPHVMADLVSGFQKHLCVFQYRLSFWGRRRGGVSTL